jgi:drug/metabolite transporter (DMT)-like permease
MQRPRLAAKRRRCGGHGSLAERIAGFLLNGYFFVALILYARLTVLWVWILSFTPLSRAYPFLALAFALTPALGCLVFAEPLRYGS